MRLEHWFYTIPLRVRSLFRRYRVEDELDEFQMMRRHLANGVQVIHLARQNMVLGNLLEVLRSERQVHGMAGLIWEINCEARKDGVHGFNFAETPASMKTAAAFGQERKKLDMPGFDFSSSC